LDRGPLLFLANQQELQPSAYRFNNWLRQENAGGAASQMKQKLSRTKKAVRLYRSPNARHPAFRRLDEAGSDELLDDWMVAGPAAEPTSPS
jgi:hypothetical protein